MRNAARSRHAAARLAAAPPLALKAALTLALACAAPRPSDAGRAQLADALARLSAGDLEGVDEQACALFADTQAEAGANALPRFFAGWLLAQAHARAAESGPFLRERTHAASRIGALGQRDDPERRPAVDSHRLATIYHASQARALYGAAARSGRERQGDELVPAELLDFGVEQADANLQILLATTYSRLGFTSEVAKSLARSPELLQQESAVEALQRYRVPPELRPWTCAMVFDHLRDADEEQAYRFAIVALEGQQRFGHGLPQREIARLEEWILHGASVQFVDPKSQTPYLPGATRSPISGVPHLEYVPVERR